MADKTRAESKQVEGETADSGRQDQMKSASAPRKIPGNLPYLAAHGTLKRALERLIDASRPDKFNADYMENVLKLSGGAARGTIPILKKMGFLSSEGAPTELYAKFRTEGGRGTAALQALRNGFPEIFKRSEYAHTVDDTKLRDIIVEITGLKGNEPITQAIKSTFNAVKSYIPAGMNFTPTEEEYPVIDETPQNRADKADTDRTQKSRGHGVGLVYNINIVLPETSDLKVLNAIFKSIKENLI